MALNCPRCESEANRDTRKFGDHDLKFFECNTCYTKFYFDEDVQGILVYVNELLNKTKIK